MASEIEICNLALSNIRAGSINSFNEGSVQAQQCKLKYGILRDRCLREIAWQFNNTIRPLASLSVDIFNWAYTYSYPVDCLKIHRLVGAYEAIPQGSSDVVSRLRDPSILSLRDAKKQIPYEVFNVDDVRVIGADESNLRANFARKVTDPNLFSDDFIMALSHLMASELAVPIVGAELGRALRSDSLTMYKEYLASAIATDMNDTYHTPEESDFVNVRR